MLALFAAVLAASTPSPALEAAVPWWEKITITVDDKGKQHSCRYESSLSPTGAEACDEKTAAGLKVGVEGPQGNFSKVTFERRFSPDRLDPGRLQPGDELLGRQVMFLTIDAEGTIESCHVVATLGDVLPDYNCSVARKERFKVEASADPGARQAFMTVLAYGHTEQIA